MDPNAEIKKLVSDEQSQAIAEMNLDKVKAKAAAAKADRIREEEELSLTEQGFRKPKEQEEQHNPMMPQQQQTIGMDPAMLLHGIGKWDPEARQDLFDRLAGDDDFALNWSRAFNSTPQQQMPMNAQQAMNPWMNPMMMQQPQAPAEPPESAASMMTAMIAAVAQLKELSGGDDNNSAMMEKMMERMERMDERQAKRDAETQQRLMEFQQSQQKTGISTDDVTKIVHATIANSSTDQLAASIESINGVVTGLQSLGVVQRADATKENSKDKFEEMKWRDEMAFKREERVREDTREDRSADIEIAKHETTKGMLSMMINMSQEAKDSPSKDDTKDKDTPLPPAVARAVVS